jgi:glucan phosphoethanolaminetransferase (alkaline phosphatase superfamily)
LLIIALFFCSISYKFYRTVYKSYKSYANLIARAEESKASDFEIIKRRENDRDIRVVIIGESVRKDYLSVYGYPHKTTPFLDGANGIFIDSMIAPAASTMASLSRALTAKEGDKIYWSRTVVDLANQTGHETHWLSNSGFSGKTSSAVSIIALRADRQNFLNANESVDSGAKDDFEFLNEFETILQSSFERPKLVFLHMAGSHAPACNRLYAFNNRYSLPYGKEHNCYLATIEKLDSFIEKLTEKMNQSKLNWSLVYFSDHGEGHYGAKGDIGLRHDGSKKQGYEVPLFVIDSLSTDHIVLNRRVSGERFIDLFASWIGVETDKTDSNYTFYDFPEDRNITTPNGDFDDLKDDPALY